MKLDVLILDVLILKRTAMLVVSTILRAVGTLGTYTLLSSVGTCTVCCTCTICTITFKVIVKIFTLISVKLFKGEDDNEQDDQVYKDGRDGHDCETISNFISRQEVIALGPQNDLANSVSGWNQPQNLDEHVPPFFDGTDNYIDNGTNGANNQ